MADVRTTTKTLKLLAGFADADDRTISLNNPRENLSWSDLSAITTAASPVLIGDKYGAAFTRFKEAKYVTSTQIKLDLNITP